MNNAIEKRQQQEKELILEQLKKCPIVSVACEKAAVPRPNYYRWKKEDPEFSKLADEAIREGEKLASDIAESQLLTLIKNSNLGAIIFWLRHHHPNYANKIEVTARLKQDEKLTPYQEALIDKALKLAALVPTINNLKDEEPKKL